MLISLLAGWTFKSTISLFLVLLLSNLCGAQPQQGLLFEINKPSLDNPSYLFGTVHMMCEKDYQLENVLSETLKKVDRLVLELDMDNPELNEEMRRLSLNPGMENLLVDLSDEQKNKIDEWFNANYSLGIDQLGVMKPFALYSMMIPKFMSCEDLISIELSLLNLAKKEGLEIEGLETLQFQMSLFEEIDAGEQISWILQMIEEEEKYRDQMESLVNAYVKGDLDSLQALTSNSPEFQDHLDIMLHGRNTKWIPLIDEFVRSGPTMIAVGAGHLSGEKGLLQLLSSEGYTIKKLPLTP